MGNRDLIRDWGFFLLRELPCRSFHKQHEQRYEGVSRAEISGTVCDCCDPAAPRPEMAPGGTFESGATGRGLRHRHRAPAVRSTPPMTNHKCRKEIWKPTPGGMQDPASSRLGTDPPQGKEVPRGQGPKERLLADSPRRSPLGFPRNQPARPGGRGRPREVGGDVGRTSVATTNLVTDPQPAHGDGQVGAGRRQGSGLPWGCGHRASARIFAALPHHRRAFPRCAPRPGGGVGRAGAAPRGTDVAEGPL